MDFCKIWLSVFIFILIIIAIALFLFRRMPNLISFHFTSFMVIYTANNKTIIYIVNINNKTTKNCKSSLAEI